MCRGELDATAAAVYVAGDCRLSAYRAALLAARFSGRVRRPSFQRPASRDIDAKTKEILFLKNRVCQLEMQLSILQKERTKKGKKSR
jgi:hypothetical protein